MVATKKALDLTRAFIFGAESRNRTGTGLPPTDFKSVASTSSAISAFADSQHRITEKNEIVKTFFTKKMYKRLAKDKKMITMEIK